MSLHGTIGCVIQPNSDPVEQLNALFNLIITRFKDETWDIIPALANYKYLLHHYKNKSVYDDKCRDIIFQWLLPTCRALMNRQHNHFKNNYNMADDITNCCKLMIEIAVPLIKHKTTWASKIIFHCLNTNCKYSFYTQFGHDWRQSRGNWLEEDEMKSHEEWRSKPIKVGAHVDYLLHNRWCYGEIKKITNKQSNENNYNSQLFNIQPKMNGMYPDDGLFTHEWTLMETTRCQITRPLTQSIQCLPHMSQWRKDLNTVENNRCNVYNGLHCCQANIIATDAAANRIHVSFNDSENANTKICRWIFRDSNLLQPFDTDEKTIQIVEDDDDPDDETIFAIYRGLLGAQSFHLIDILNHFGKCGGFDAILEILENDCGISSVPLFVLSNCYKVYSRTFGKKFMCKLYDILIEKLEWLNVSEMDGWKSKHFTEVVSCIGNLMCRYHTSDIVKRVTEKWTLELTLRRLYSGDIDALNEIERLFGHAEQLNANTLVNWAENNNVLRCLLGLTNVIVLKSDVLIVGYTRQCFGSDKYLSSDLLNLMTMWFRDDSNSSFMLSCRAILIFMDKIGGLEDIHIDMLLNTMISLNIKGDVMTVVDLIRHLIRGVHKNDKMYDILGTQIMSKCVKHLIEHKYVIHTMNVLRITIMANIEMKHSIIGHLIDNEKLLEIFFDDIKYFKNYVRSYIDVHEDESVINNKKLFVTNNTYIEHVDQRIDFLKYISIHYNHFKLKEYEKDILYLEFVENALTCKEREIAIRKLTKIIGYDEDKYPLFSNVKNK